MDVSQEIVERMQRWMDGEPVPPRRELGMRDYLRMPTAEWNTALDIDSHLNRFAQRQEFLKTFGFAIPCRELLEACYAHRPLVEVGAGTGYLSHLIKRFAEQSALYLRDDALIATDPTLSHFPGERIGAWFPTVPLQAKTAVRRYRDRNVLMSWPGYQDTWPAQALKAMRVGRVLLTITEGDGGCCADDRFFAILGDCFEETDEVELPVFYGMHDRLTIYRKKRPYRRTRLDWSGIDTRSEEQREADFKKLMSEFGEKEKAHVDT